VLEPDERRMVTGEDGKRALAISELGFLKLASQSLQPFARELVHENSGTFEPETYIARQPRGTP